MNKPLIIISNDDGFNANGFKTLIKIARKYADIIAIAPDSERSGQSHAVTVINPLKTNLILEEPGLKLLSCNGTPVDCAKLGIKVFANRTPDLVISGINHGSNVGANIFYSGTMGIAIEAAFEKIPSIGFSLCSHSPSIDFSYAEPYIDNIIANVLSTQQLPSPFCLSVNIPYLTDGNIKGMKISTMSNGVWNETYIERSIPTTKKPYYWVTGVFSEDNPLPDSEQAIVTQGFISILPLSLDLTHYKEKETIANILKLNS